MLLSKRKKSKTKERNRGSMMYELMNGLNNFVKILATGSKHRTLKLENEDKLVVRKFQYL